MKALPAERSTIRPTQCEMATMQIFCRQRINGAEVGRRLAAVAASAAAALGPFKAETLHSAGSDDKGLLSSYISHSIEVCIQIVFQACYYYRNK